MDQDRGVAVLVRVFRGLTGLFDRDVDAQSPGENVGHVVTDRGVPQEWGAQGLGHEFGVIGAPEHQIDERAVAEGKPELSQRRDDRPGRIGQGDVELTGQLIARRLIQAEGAQPLVPECFVRSPDGIHQQLAPGPVQDGPPDEIRVLLVARGGILAQLLNGDLAGAATGQVDALDGGAVDDGVEQAVSHLVRTGSGCGYPGRFLGEVTDVAGGVDRPPQLNGVRLTVRPEDGGGAVRVGDVDAGAGGERGRGQHHGVGVADRLSPDRADRLLAAVDPGRRWGECRQGQVALRRGRGQVGADHVGLHRAAGGCRGPQNRLP
nr:hypothetical protein Ade03nite_66520 [Actinoplanes derwentensis]